MKLKYTFEDVNMGEEIVSVPVGEGSKSIHGVLKMNTEGKEIMDLLKEETTEGKIIDYLTSKYENDRNEITAFVRRTIHTLYEAGLLSED